MRLCNALGIMIALLHEPGRVRGCGEILQKTLVASDSHAHSLSASPRNLTDRQLRQIWESDGMLSFNFATFYIRDDGTASPRMGWEPLLPPRPSSSILAKTVRGSARTSMDASFQSS